MAIPHRPMLLIGRCTFVVIMDSWVNYGFPKVSEGMYNRIVNYSNNQEAYFCIIREAAEKIEELKQGTVQN